MRITCPICGERHLSEFTYEGDATVVRPAPDDLTPEAWLDAVYERDNPRGRHSEYWQHTGGCRAWLKVERDTLTHEVHRVELVGPWAGQAEPWTAPAKGRSAAKAGR